MRHGPLAFVLLFAGSADAAGGVGEGGASTLIWQGLNLLLLLGVIVYFARKPVMAFMRGRREQVKGDLDSAAEVLSEAESRLAEWQARADRLDAEIEEIKQTARQRAEGEREHILADAEASAERIENDAVAAVEQEVARARDTLRAEAAELATRLASELLRQNVTDADQQKLVNEFVARIETSGRSH